MHALGKYGIKVSDRSELYKFIGPPLVWSFQNYYGFTEKQAYEAIDYFHEYFTAGGMFENEVYPGIPQLLEQLRDKGYQLAIASSKPEIFVKRILRHFGLYDYFNFVGGADIEGEGNRFKKEDVITYVLQHFPQADKNDILMIGDREHDIIGARHNGLDSLGVAYGYGSEEEFQEAGATYIVRTVEDLGDALLEL
jgi:haloacid dehalogenase superfamily, subfamily IA, variant 1 with third motif having Dx(3-4)D or Dx(3-4)E